MGKFSEYDRNNMTYEEFNEKFNIDLGASLFVHGLEQRQKKVTRNDLYNILGIDTICGRDEIIEGYEWDPDHKEIIKNNKKEEEYHGNI